MVAPLNEKEEVKSSQPVEWGIHSDWSSRNQGSKWKTVFRRFWRKLTDIPYWIRTHTYNRYHIVDCRCPQNDYSWGWCDRDHLILFACFKILKDFVELELPHSYTDYTVDGWREARIEIETLYEWWTVGRAREHRAAHRLDRPMQESFEAINKLDERDNEMLERLIKVRGYMWT